jgi:hypothetical protein
MNYQNDDDDKFMAQFTHRLKQEPLPEWPALKQEGLPWLEMGWAFAAALFLYLSWAPLKFEITNLYANAAHSLENLPITWIFLGLGAIFGLAQWLGPKKIKSIF